MLFDRLSELQSEKDRISVELSKHQAQKTHQRVNDEDVKKAFAVYRHTLASADRQNIKEIIKRFVTKITVYKDRVDIEFNTVFSFVQIPVKLLETLHLTRDRLRQASGL